MRTVHSTRAWLHIPLSVQHRWRWLGAGQRDRSGTVDIAVTPEWCEEGNLYTAAPMAEENNGNGTSSGVLVALPGANFPWRTITVGETLKPTFVEQLLHGMSCVPSLWRNKIWLPFHAARWSWSLFGRMVVVNYDDQAMSIDFAAAAGIRVCVDW